MNGRIRRSIWPRLGFKSLLFVVSLDSVFLGGVILGIVLLGSAMLPHAVKAQAPATAAPLPRIVCVGDSITQGADATTHTWRRPLQDQLREAGYDYDFVGSRTTRFLAPAPMDSSYDEDHEAYWGWHTDALRDRLPLVLSGYTPDVALVHLGSNDTFNGFSTASTAQEMSELIDHLRGKNPQISVIIARPILTLYPAVNSRLIELGQSFDDLAQRKNQPDSPVTTVNLQTDFDASQLTYDGIHPNALGDAWLASRWFPALKTAIERLEQTSPSRDSNEDEGEDGRADVPGEQGNTPDDGAASLQARTAEPIRSSEHPLAGCSAASSGAVASWPSWTLLSFCILRKRRHAHKRA